MATDRRVTAAREFLAGARKPGEEWRDVRGHEGLYQVSDLGRVFSFGQGAWGPRLLKLNPVGRYGHLKVGLWKDGRRREVLVHVLVLEAFVGPRPAGTEGCHGDGNPGNNACSNLRWDTPGGNRQDSVRHGTAGRPPIRGGRNGNAKLTELQVRDIRRRWLAGESQRGLALEFGVSRPAISDVVYRRRWRHVA